MQKKYSFHKNYTKNNVGLEFHYIGKNKGNIKIKEFEILLDECFSKMKSYNDIEKIIIWIRAILKDFEEIELTIYIAENQKSTKASFKNKNLVKFKLEEKLGTDETLNIRYEKNLIFEIYISKYNYDKVIQEEKIKSAEELVNKLKQENKTIQIYSENELMCNTYKLFYQENPNFSKEETNTRFQTMFYILQEFSLFLGYIFVQPYEENVLPVSLDLEHEVERLSPLGEIEVDLTKIKMDEQMKRKIETIGKFVRKYTQNKIDNLSKLAIILYMKNMLNNYGIEDLSTIIDDLPPDVEESKELIRKINKKIKSDKKK